MPGKAKPESTERADERTVTIGKRSHRVADFSSQSRAALEYVDMTDIHIRDLEARLSIARTAKAKYIQNLKRSLQDNN